MKTYLYLIILLHVSVLAYTQSISPQVISTAGTSFVFQGAFNKIDWTLGEVSIDTYQNTENYVSQGFHQTYFITNTSVAENGISEIDYIKVFPNPFQDQLLIRINASKTQTIDTQLSDLTGRVLWKRRLVGQIISEQIPTQYLAAGIYMLSFYSGGNHNHTFKIQKLQ